VLVASGNDAFWRRTRPRPSDRSLGSSAATKSSAGCTGCRRPIVRGRSSSPADSSGNLTPAPTSLRPRRVGLCGGARRPTHTLAGLVRILFVADVFGSAGHRAVRDRLPRLREELGIDFCRVNGENAGDGRGITPKLADRLLEAGADVVTLGNHTWARSEILPYLDSSERVIRPADLGAGRPGRGLAVAAAVDGAPVAVVNLLGWLFLDVPVTPFEILDEL